MAGEILWVESGTGTVGIGKGVRGEGQRLRGGSRRDFMDGEGHVSAIGDKGSRKEIEGY